MYRWHFNRVRPADKVREPIQGEFFASDAINNPGEALIREGIQNSLDARDPAHAGPVVVRIRVGNEDQSIPSQAVMPFLAGLRPHLEAPGNGLRGIPPEDELCSFLLFEDFGTTGLTGDISEWRPTADNPPNHFFHFYRAEGRSAKTDQKLGRWGVGKQVFLRASRINTVFGLTVRSDDRRKLLMGMTVLKSHDVVDERFGPDGWFGIREDPSGLVLPIEDPKFIHLFSETFKLLRRDGDAGLSLVVPWCDLSAQVGADTIVHAVLKDYFWPILKGELEVWVDTGRSETLLNRDNVVRSLSETGGPDPYLASTLGLAEWALCLNKSELRQLQLPPDGVWKWSAELFPAGMLEQLREAFLAGERVALRVPVEVRELGAEPRPSHFSLFLQRQGHDLECRPVYVRENIIIPDVRKSKVPRGVLSILVAEDGPIAGFLGDAENPSHTQWQKDSANFKGKYDRGPSLLNFIIQSIAEVIALLSAEDRRVDRDLLSKFFSIPVPAPMHEPEPAAGAGTEPETADRPPARPSPFVISAVDGGFSVTSGLAEAFHGPRRIRIAAAYDIRVGNPFKKYRRADFDFSSNNIHFEVRGAMTLSKRENVAEVEVSIPDFRIKVTGFDPSRDLRVDVDYLEDAGANPEA